MGCPCRRRDDCARQLGRERGAGVAATNSMSSGQEPVRIARRACSRAIRRS